MAGGEGAAATREGAIGIANGDEAGGEDDGGEGAAAFEGAIANDGGPSRKHRKTGQLALARAKAATWRAPNMLTASSASTFSSMSRSGMW